jgi:hypothetical protein
VHDLADVFGLRLLGLCELLFLVGGERTFGGPTVFP